MVLAYSRGPDDATALAIAYVVALPAVVVYCVVLARALASDRWKRKGWGAAALVWGIVFPLAFMQLIPWFGPGVGMAVTVGLCSGVTAILLGLATRSWQPVYGCGGGFAFASMVWLAQEGDRSSSPVIFVVMEVVWLAPVVGAMFVWMVGRRKSWADPLRCAACGYDLRGLAGGVCPECGKGDGTTKT